MGEAAYRGRRRPDAWCGEPFRRFFDLRRRLFLPSSFRRPHALFRGFPCPLAPCGASSSLVVGVFPASEPTVRRSVCRVRMASLPPAHSAGPGLQLLQLASRLARELRATFGLSLPPSWMATGGANNL